MTSRGAHRHRRWLVSIVLGASMTVPVAASAAETTVVAGQGGDRFTPTTVEISAGDAVVWRNSSGWHNVHGDGFQSTVGNDAWTFRHTFAEAGTFAYVCDVHPTMKGTVVVTGASTPSPSPTTAPAPSPKPSPKPTATASPVATSAPEPEETASAPPTDPSSTETATDTPSDAPTDGATQEPSGTESPIGTPEPSPTDGPSPTPSPSPVVAAPVASDGGSGLPLLFAILAVAALVAAGAGALVRGRRAR